MDEKTMELIAIGASIGAHCQPCLAYHVVKAKALGLADSEIHEAIAVGHRVEKGAMVAMREFSKCALDTSNPDGSACCEGKKTTGGKSGCG